MPARKMVRIENPNENEIKNWGNKPITGGSHFPVGFTCKLSALEWFKFEGSDANGFPALTTSKTEKDGTNNLLFSAHFVPNSNKFTLVENQQITINQIVNSTQDEFKKMQTRKEFAYLKNINSEIFKNTLNQWAFEKIYSEGWQSDKDFLGHLLNELGKEQEIKVAAEIALHTFTSYWGQSTPKEEWHHFFIWELVK